MKLYKTGIEMREEQKRKAYKSRYAEEKQEAIPFALKELAIKNAQYPDSPKSILCKMGLHKMGYVGRTWHKHVNICLRPGCDYWDYDIPCAGDY